PDSYQASFLSDPAGAWKLLDELGVKEAELFPWAQGAADLGRAGAFDDAAPAVSRMYQAMEADQTGAYKNVDLNVAEWRQIFLLVRDDHHVARFSWGTTKMAANEEQRLQALRSMFPTAHIDAIYRHGEQWSVDPLLVLGLMRQESVYQQWALSPVGAIGLMQVMPRTGAKVAAMMGDSHYSPESLENPSVNIRYGIYYLSRLLDRFGGSFPMAVGSYNGGPHNMSSWLSPWGAEIRMDDYVEQIPYPETRDYIKKVSGYYATYTALYAPTGARVVVPMKVEKDDPSIVNF
ncbi:MAG TPA: lytic transglycosylase domain-containing protein, partial [Myxococcota bacterium]|nr:lytic transglycosylase domain-containing protein [Myxococcota bacterium]